MRDNIILSKQDIENITKKLGKAITNKIKDDEKVPIVVGVLKGAIPFMMDLIRNIDCPIYTDFIQISSYSGTKNTGKVQLIKDISFDCEDRTVLIVEDIIDTGKSMDFLIKRIKTHNPKQVLVCALFDKKEARTVDVKADFVGYELKGKEFLNGYGLDYYELERNLPFVYSATEEDIKELDKLIK